MRQKAIGIFFAHPHHTIHFTYQEMLFHPPEGINYVNIKRFGYDYANVQNKRPGIVDRLLGALSYLPIPTYAKVDQDCDVVYASQCIPLTQKPWILDVEFPEGIARFHPRLFRFPLMRWIIRSRLKNDRCKGIVFWSKAARDGFAHVIGEDIVKQKGVIIRPAISVPGNEKQRRTTRKDILFVGRDFIRKGGLEAITAFERVARKHKSVKFIVVSALPPEIDQKKYPHVTFLAKIDRDVLLKRYYPNTGIYLMPSFHDTIILVWLEAMRFGVPVVALKDYASEEVLAGCGILIDSYDKEWFTEHHLTNTRYPTIERLVAAHRPEEFERIVSEIAAALDKLLSDDTLRRKLGERGRQLVTRGEFSIAHKNKELKKLFERAVKER
jgi:glycosyltransferase involved in cell wall biosynthesis